MSLNATFKRASIEAAMEFGSIDELAGYLAEKGVVLTKIFGDDMEIVVKGIGGSDSTAISSGTVETGEGEQGGTAGKKRGRPAKGADPATAIAPPPAPIPGAPAAPAAPPADLVAQNAAAGGGVPDYLKRVETPPAPPAPPAPPIPPAAPPSGILAGKVIGELERRGSDDITKKALVDWLASPGYGLVMPTASFDETIAAVRLMQDDKLSAVATALQIAA